MFLMETMPTKKRTRRDEIFSYIADYAFEHHNAPSTYEIAAKFEIAQQTVYGHMMKLMAEDRLEQIDGKWKLPTAEYIRPDEV
jgi:predicted DNA-binding protein YlxM (UPF0122 family)